ncbi:hypothetical protein OIU84_013606 [Salix udensis]|uniref:Uncharacterized protein n=1 Tax=Salix udensis TaxID=889485 RepID=A0AAD6JJ19_9ROSI|nr:hypothetical protein OIU84_013606 [Salix udensis]
MISSKLHNQPLHSYQITTSSPCQCKWHDFLAVEEDSSLLPKNSRFKSNPKMCSMDALRTGKLSSNGIRIMERLGSSNAEAMLSKTEPVFYALTCFFFLVCCLEVQFLFPTFIDFCKQSMRNTDNSPDSLPQSTQVLLGRKFVWWAVAVPSVLLHSNNGESGTRGQ